MKSKLLLKNNGNNNRRGALRKRERRSVFYHAIITGTCIALLLQLNVVLIHNGTVHDWKKQRVRGMVSGFIFLGLFSSVFTKLTFICHALDRLYLFNNTISLRFKISYNLESNLLFIKYYRQEHKAKRRLEPEKYKYCIQCWWKNSYILLWSNSGKFCTEPFRRIEWCIKIRVKRRGSRCIGSRYSWKKGKNRRIKIHSLHGI